MKTEIRLQTGDVHELLAYEAGNGWVRIVALDNVHNIGISLSEEQRKELGRFLLGKEENKNV